MENILIKEIKLLKNNNNYKSKNFKLIENLSFINIKNINKNILY